MKKTELPSVACEPVSTSYARNLVSISGLAEKEPELIAFAADGAGVRTRMLSFGQVSVNVRGLDDGTGEVVAKALRVLPGWVLSLCDALDESRAALAKVKPRPCNLLGQGCVRLRDDGLFLLNSHEKGWGEFAIRLDDWNELFLRYNVRVDEPRTDKWGQWWPVQPMKPAT